MNWGQLIVLDQAVLSMSSNSPSVHTGAGDTVDVCNWVQETEAGMKTIRTKPSPEPLSAGQKLLTVSKASSQRELPKK